jgi:hypothetical protein
VTEELHDLLTIAGACSSLRILSKPFVTHIGQGFGRQLGIRCRAASLWRPSEGMGERDLKTRCTFPCFSTPKCSGGEENHAATRHGDARRALRIGCVMLGRQPEFNETGFTVDARISG